MSAPENSDQVPGLADGLAPSHTYVPNQGYVNPDKEANSDMAGQEPTEEYDEDEDEDYEDIFEEELDREDILSSDPSDLTKAYNRQRKLNELASDSNVPKWTYPKTNTQKPTINTHASIDDQVKSLTKHAAKIKLDDQQSGLSSKGDKGGDRADRATSEQVLDPRTRMLLLQMINRGLVSEIHGCLSTGKEANVYHAILLSEDDETVQVHRAIKVYKTSILVFKDRDKYVTGEFRFRQGYNKSNNRAMVKMWAEKEMRNLRRIYSAGIPCPEPIYLRLHVLAMGFIGSSKGVAAPRLKDVEFDIPEPDLRWRSLYMELLSLMRVMYQVCRLVHADLSEYNILYHKNRLYIIDVSQSVEHDHPRSLEFLRMDIKNVSDFFRRKGVHTLSERTIFQYILAPEGPVDISSGYEEMFEAIEKLFTARDESGATEESEEVDTAVFRQQYIPQTLEQVYDVERDVEKIRDGGGNDLVYGDLLATNKSKPVADGEDVDSDASGGVSLSDSESDEDEEEKDPFAPKQPRGKRFEDKDAKRDHKAKVKEEKREQRAKKMPKHLKKKLVSTSSRKKK
ncbi:uncharacterized protein N7483_008641 [Penicillium malachiteum]|uniref:uncharacterized protein n=1 Tax=Penicillium malachiteum TaxID=1324776 RepID=UPI002547BF06|nr:uncharacterized protein N7483_008641 [Penicillium malachiteum]KAJ5720707.1 hypothetical protein N7483_008641 [Penicillium malachiteum]